MAEIKIQPRKKSPWPYILALVAVIALIFLAYKLQSQPEAEKTSAFFPDSSRLESTQGDSLSILRDSTAIDTTNMQSDTTNNNLR